MSSSVSDVRVRVTRGAFELWLEAVAHQQDDVPAAFTVATSSGDSSRSCGSAPAGVRFVTCTRGPADLLGRVGERIEGGDDAVAVARRRVTARGERGRHRTDDDRADENENDSQSH